MDCLLKHNLIKQYLQTNFKEKEFRRAIKYTLILGIQNLYQQHGINSSFTLKQLTSMITSNNGTIQVQSDLPALSQCLKDIKSQLGDIQNELDHTKSSSNSKQITIKSDAKIDKKKVRNKKNKDKNTKYGNYPVWWPNDDGINENDGINDDDTPNDDEISDNDNNNSNPPHLTYPNVYNQPIAFSIPKEQFDKNNDNIVELHLNLYPEYLQKCLDPNSESKINKNKIRNKMNKINKKSRSKSLIRSTESSQAKTFGIPTQSAFLKANNRNIAPCLKYQNNSDQPSISNNIKKRKQKQRKKRNENRRKSLPNKMNKGKVPKYLQNVESRIKRELRKDKLRNDHIQKEKESFLRDLARNGLDQNKNDQYIDEWREKFGYNRLGNDDISRPSAISVADAMIQSDIIQAMDPSLNKKPTLITNQTQDDINNNSFNINFLSDLREWASGLTQNNNDSITNDITLIDYD